jgi:hypothetical protein
MHQSFPKEWICWFNFNLFKRFVFLVFIK